MSWNTNRNNTRPCRAFVIVWISQDHVVPKPRASNQNRTLLALGVFYCFAGHHPGAPQVPSSPLHGDYVATRTRAGCLDEEGVCTARCQGNGFWDIWALNPGPWSCKPLEPHPHHVQEQNALDCVLDLLGHEVHIDLAVKLDMFHLKLKTRHLHHSVLTGLSTHISCGILQLTCRFCNCFVVQDVTFDTSTSSKLGTAHLEQNLGFRVVDSEIYAILNS